MPERVSVCLKMTIPDAETYLVAIAECLSKPDWSPLDKIATVDRLCHRALDTARIERVKCEPEAAEVLEGGRTGTAVSSDGDGAG